ncbi:uncharacterized protein LOC125956512 isoform X2 [Anopheles darlingi]|uniref:uncharacterized protein LOC125956512 isoform X2 n=1 Tax=Anopheles darlingi TaxID=43151 RepID=UPI002100630B|nr:uncharacterized protein LOC125956512 isoform X2 [Anopheles darlingi]
MLVEKLPSGKAMALQDLDEYSLAHVFLFLSVADLDRCLLVCKKFQHIIQRFVYSKKCMLALVVNSPKTCNLSLYQYTARKRAKLEENWRDGRYEEHTLFQHNVMYISQMDIDKDFLYMTHGGCLQAHKRTKNRYLVDTRIHWQVGCRRDPDISSLAKENDRFLAGRLDGRIMIYDSTTGQTTLQSVATDVIKSVDFCRNVYAVTTKFQATYILNRSWREHDFENAELKHSHVYPRAYETIKLKGTRLAAGMFHCGRKQALQMIDLQRFAKLPLNEWFGNE